MSKHSAALTAFVKNVKPKPLVMSAGAVLGGFVAAELGGRLAQLVPQVDAFANGGVVQDAAVSAIAGGAVDAAATAIIYMTAGPQTAVRVGQLMAVGTAAAVVTKVAAPYIAQAIDGATSAVAGLLGKAAPAPAAPAGLADFRQLSAPAGLADFAPGGESPAFAFPGGNPYADAFG